MEVRTIPHPLRALDGGCSPNQKCKFSLDQGGRHMGSKIIFTGAGATPMLNAWFVWDGKTELNETRLLMLSRGSAQQEGFDV